LISGHATAHLENEITVVAVAVVVVVVVSKLKKKQFCNFIVVFCRLFSRIVFRFNLMEQRT